MGENKRLSYIDAAKGIAVLLVIFGHCFRQSMRTDFYWCDFSYLYVYRFHVTLLFVLSGMGYSLTREKNLLLGTGAYIKKKAKSLLLPWFSYSVIIYLVFAILWLIAPVRELLDSSAYKIIAPADFFRAMIYNENPYCFHVWYLQTLFFFTVFAFLTEKYLGKKAFLVIAAVLIVLSPALYSLYFETANWALKGFFQKLPFFLIGILLTDRMIKKHEKALLFSGIAAALAEGAFIMSKAAFSGAAAILAGYAENIVILFICLGIIAFCSHFENRLSKFSAFGKSTLPYYLYHQPFCCAFLGIVLYEKLNINAVLTVIICFASSIAVPKAVLWIFKKTGIGKLFQKIGLPA